ncbi:MAG: hypothetical protein ABS951_13135 [Solibacillus sp.]
MKKFLVIIGVVACLTAPWWGFIISKKTPLEIAVIDVSSTDKELKERRGIYEALQLEKVVQSNGQTYEADLDYFGVKVVNARKDILYHDLPLRIDNTDVIYLADMYGIKEEALNWTTEPSDKVLYGGLTGSDWRVIESRIAQKTPSMLIVEYNSFTETTEQTVREQLADQLGIMQTGYEARYFEDLAEMGANGSGLVIRNKETAETFILQSVQKATFTTTAKGEGKFRFKQFEPFRGWFDLATASDADILAEFQLAVSNEDEAVLTTLGLPKTFVAVANVMREQSQHYYFAGKFSYKEKNPLPIPKMIGYKKLHELIQRQDAFYWKNYLPMMEQILHEAKHTEGVEVTPISLSPAKEQGLAYNARINGNQYEVLQNGEWQPLTIKGVNIGMAKPGVFPGEAGITKEDYAGWFKAIGELGSNAIRIYTIHPPGFYEALLEYNESHEQPLYLYHGVWLDEEPVEEHLDVYGGSTENFQKEIQHIVDIIHGNAVIEPRPGHASGTYTADVSPYIIGWMLGIEWYALAVENVNEKYSGKAQFNGQYFTTKDAAPFEIWIAEQMEFTAKYEAENYQWMRPFSFTNWVTTDLLEHPYEPSVQEDLVGVNPNVIYEKGVLAHVGQFASYHVYPYYPDFLNYTPEYVNFIDHRGKKNNYAAYLKDLHAAHRMPVLISEFGIPASRGLTHVNPFGWNQGFIAEREQGEILVGLFEDILQEGMLGGLVFTWQDEWFKRTWNTMDLDNPDQRPYWSNAQTNEQQFGILSFDTLKIKVDGDTTDWFGIAPFYKTEQMTMYIDSDERYLYMRLDVEDAKFSDNYYPVLYLNTLANQGNATYEGHALLNEAEFALALKGEKNSKLVVDAYYDLFQKFYGDQLKMVPFEGSKQKNNGQFIPIEYALNKSITIPILNKVLPFEKYETGILRQGNGNPDSVNYDSLADYEVNEKDGIVEVRIPWLLLNVTDPSRLEVWSDLYKGSELTREITPGFEMGALLIKNEQVIATIPKQDTELRTYTWRGWGMPEYKERLKESYYILQKKFTETK